MQIGVRRTAKLFCLKHIEKHGLCAATVQKPFNRITISATHLDKPHIGDFYLIDSTEKAASAKRRFTTFPMRICMAFES